MKYKVADSSYTRLAKDIKYHFSESSDILWNRRNKINIISHKDVKIAVKSFKVPHLVNQIIYKFFRASKAERSYANALRLRQLGVRTPEPIAYIEFSSFALFKESYYLSKLFDFEFELRAVLNDEKFPHRDMILKEFVLFAYQLHEKGVVHNDFSPGNVLIKSDNNYTFAIVDVNRMKFKRYNDVQRFKNLSRFSTSMSDLKLIAKEYACLSGINEQFATDLLLKYHNKHQRYISRKNKIKTFNRIFKK